jgi:hypothetical protein
MHKIERIERDTQQLDQRIQAYLCEWALTNMMRSFTNIESSDLDGTDYILYV